MFSSILKNLTSRFSHHIISLDPAALYRLKPLSGSTIRILITEPAIDFQLQIIQDSIVVSPIDRTNELEYSAELSGTLQSFVSYYLDQEAQKGIPASHYLAVKGDIKIVQTLAVVLTEFQPDWEGELAEVIGDIPAHALGQMIRNSIKWHQRFAKRMVEDTMTYLQRENKVLVHPLQVESFYQEIEDLNLRSDRLLARYQQLVNSD